MLFAALSSFCVCRTNFTPTAAPAMAATVRIRASNTTQQQHNTTKLSGRLALPGGLNSHQAFLSGLYIVRRIGPFTYEYTDRISSLKTDCHYG
jgi:hypothetical protein